jgi:hypothetical protein
MCEAEVFEQCPQIAQPKTSLAEETDGRGDLAQGKLALGHVQLQARVEAAQQAKLSCK